MGNVLLQAVSVTNYGEEMIVVFIKELLAKELYNKIFRLQIVNVWIILMREETIVKSCFAIMIALDMELVIH